MNVKRVVCASTLAAGVGVAGLFGVGVGSAAADPGQPCGGPHAPVCGPAQPGRHDGPQQPVDWRQRGVDAGRRDHQPFNWNGQQVTPMPAGNGAGWGFWFLNQWIPM